VLHVDRSTEYRADYNSRFPQILLNTPKTFVLSEKNISLLIFLIKIKHSNFYITLIITGQFILTQNKLM